MKAWENFLALQESEIGAETVNKWLRSLKLIKFDACNLYLEAKDTFHAMWFEEHVRPKLQTKFFNNNSRRIKVHLSVAGASVSSKTLKTKSKKPTDKTETASSSPSFTLSFDETDPHCTFKYYVVSDCNQLTYKLLCEITGYDPIATRHDSSKRILCSFNPLYIYGANGTGKSHLLMATAQTLRLQGLHALYVRAESFTQHVVTAIRAGEMPTFRNAYRNIDVLLIDDVHLLARKGATQEELFHTFNTLHVAGRQIILSANCTPQELQFIEPRLVSRFEWGVVLPLETMTSDELVSVLKVKASALNFLLNDKLVEFLVSTFPNTKSLMRALEALVLRCHMSEREGRFVQNSITVSLARNMLADLIENELKSALTSTRIIQTVAEHYGIRVEDILSKAQSRDCVVPRQISMYLCRTRLKMPYMQIGDLFGRDHSTVMSSVKQVQKGLESLAGDLANSFNLISKRL